MTFEGEPMSSSKGLARAVPMRINKSPERSAVIKAVEIVFESSRPCPAA